jgi:hypothetical protein
MKKSKIVTYMAYPIGVGWAKEAAHRLYPEKYKKGSWYGKIVLVVAPWFSQKIEEWHHRKGGK